MGRRALGSRYFLEERIGRGGMGTVWRGRDRATGAGYAIKVLNESFAADPTAVARFVRERTALISFRHPHVVTLHDMIVEGDTLALVMDLVPGGDLSRLRRDRGGRLEPGQALELTAQVAGALAAAHAAGIVHRDVKPANILLRADDDALLADFGIARLAAQPRDTTSGMVLGTVEYMAPELIAGQEPGPGGDLYALGVTLYELVAGAPPFTGNPAAVLHAHVAGVPARPAGTGEDVWEVISRCLEKDPARRPSARALAARLRDLAPGGPPGHAGLTVPAAAQNRAAGPAAGQNRPTGSVAYQHDPTGPVAGQNRPTGPAANQNSPTGPVAYQGGPGSLARQVQVQPLPAATEPAARGRRPGRAVMAVAASVVAVAGLVTAVAIANPFSSAAVKTTNTDLTAPAGTSGASVQATVSPRSSLTGKKQSGTGAQPANGTVSATPARPGAQPAPGTTTPSSRATAPSVTTSSATASGAPSSAVPSSGATPSGTPAAGGLTVQYNTADGNCLAEVYDSTEVSGDYVQASFSNNNSGYTCEGWLERSTNGGASWSTVSGYHTVLNNGDTQVTDPYYDGPGYAARACFKFTSWSGAATHCTNSLTI